MDGHDPAADPWPPWWHWYPDDYPGEPATAGADDVDMLGDYYTDGPLELVWHGEGGGRRGGDDVGVSCLRSSPPSDDVMAAWLYPIVTGEEHAGDGPKAPAATEPSEPSMATGSLGTVTTDSRGKLPTTTDVTHVVKETNTTRDSGERRKQSTAGGSTSKTRTSHHSGTHSVTEKRRRCKITERLRTLQQLVPGCDKCNQASTLEQTIQYMKSLQQQLQETRTRPAAAAALYPAVLQPPPPAAVSHQGTVAAAAAGTMVVPPFRAVLPYPHYYYHHHAAMMPAAAAAPAASVYRPAAASAAPSAAAGGGNDGGAAQGSAEKTKSPDGSTERSRF